MLYRDTKQIGAAIQRQRRQQKMTQAELAERAGTLQKTISNIETGKPTIRVQTLLDVLTALDLEITLQERGAQKAPDLEDIF